MAFDACINIIINDVVFKDSFFAMPYLTQVGNYVLFITIVSLSLANKNKQTKTQTKQTNKNTNKQTNKQNQINL